MSIVGQPDDQAAPFVRQRRRMLRLLAGFGEDEWSAQSRCAEWAVRQVVAHLVDVNAFWHASLRAGLAGTPTRVLGGFDPAATPPLLVGRMDGLPSSEVFGQFASTSEQLLGAIAELDETTWCVPAESPAGHVPIRLLVQHALWDCWIHERDIAIPLAINSVIEDDEVRSCLQYAAAIGPVLGQCAGVSGTPPPARYAVDASRPSISFVVAVGEGVSVLDEPVTDLPCLRGDAVELVEALSLRAPMPESAPPEWRRLLTGLAAAFDAA